MENFGDLVKMMLSAVIVGRRIIWPRTEKNRNPKRFHPGGSTRAKGPPDRSNPSIGSVNSIGGGNITHIKCFRLQTDASNGYETVATLRHMRRCKPV